MDCIRAREEGPHIVRAEASPSNLILGSKNWKFVIVWASDPIERSRYHIIWLLAKRKNTSLVAEVTGYCLEAICQIVRLYNQQGASGLVECLEFVSPNIGENGAISTQEVSRFYRTSKPSCG